MKFKTLFLFLLLNFSFVNSALNDFRPGYKGFFGICGFFATKELVFTSKTQDRKSQNIRRVIACFALLLLTGCVLENIDYYGKKSPQAYQTKEGMLVGMLAGGLSGFITSE